MTVLVGSRVSIHQGLVGQDDNIAALMSLWEQLQLSALELAAQPECDLLTFALTGFFLGVIMAKIELKSTEDQSEAQGSAQDNAQNSPVAVPKKKKKRGRKQSNGVQRATAQPSNVSLNLPPQGFGYVTPWTPVCAGVESQVELGHLGDQSNGTELRTRFRSQQPESRWEIDISDNEVVRYERLWDFSDGGQDPPMKEPEPVPIGLVYLSASPFTQSAPGQLGELNLGIILDSKYRGKGYACEAIQLTIRHAFEVEHCHRIQASLINLDWAHKDRMIALLTQLRFGHEGTRRRAFYNPMMAEWQDVTTLGLLATDWSIRTLLKPAPKSLWDELFLRHQREREELLHWDEMQNRGSLKRSASTETLRPPAGGLVDLGTETDSSAAESANESDATSTTSSKGKRRALWPEDDDDRTSPARENSPVSFDGGESDAHLPSDSMFRIFGPRSQSPTLSVSSVESVPLSEVSSAGSEWDMLSSSSSAGSSFGDDEE